MLKTFFEDESITKVWHHAKFDVRMLELGHEIVVAGPGGPGRGGGKTHDTMFMAHAANSGEPSFGLKPLALKYVNFPDDDLKDLKDFVKKLRRRAKAAGWMIGKDTESDYWLPRAAAKHHPEWFAGPEHIKWALRKCRKYAIGDAERTQLLKLMYDPILDEKGYRDTYDREMHLWSATYRMEA